jgi:DNA modification methylase
MYRVLKPGGKAFVVIADPSEGRFHMVKDHIARTHRATDVHFWEDLFKEKGFNYLEQESKRYRSNDWRQMFNLPVLRKLKDKAGFACAFNPIDRPGTYILQKPADSQIKV